jgi:hypothetical protein
VALLPVETEPAPGETEADEEPSALPEGTASLVFLVQDLSGRPLAGVGVFLRSMQSARAEAAALTGDTGEAFFVDLAAGSYSYRVEAYGRSELSSASPVRLEEGELEYITLRLGGADLSILGRVVNQNGEPIPAIEVSATRSWLNERLVRRDQGRVTTFTQGDGTYAFHGLEEGEYHLQTTVTEVYPSVRRTVRAGADSVDLLLTASLRVYGTLTDLRGEPLWRVRVLPTEQPQRTVYSNQQGGYEVHLAPSAGEGYRLEFYLEGYEELSLFVDAAQLSATPALQLDAELQTLSDSATVSGIVQSRRGDPVPFVNLFLQSQQQRTDYRARSDREGGFSMPGVKFGSDYRLIVLARDTYRDYLQEQIDVTGGALFLDVVLEPLASGRLTGQMIDGDGNPIPNFRLWLVNIEAQHSSVPVSSDEGGYFVVEEAPEGTLVFDTRSSPLLRVSGINLPPGGDRDVVLQLDWGNYELRGSVLDEQGFPVAGAELFLYWSNEVGGLKSSSTRKSVTDASGLFRFSQLGPGPHRLNVRASGYRPRVQNYDVGLDPPGLEVQLQPALE